MVTPFPYKPYYRKLVELERELRGKIGERSASSHSQAQSFSMHMADSGTDSIDRDDTLSLLESEKDALYEIDQAIERVHAGTYGICEITGEPISEARLWAVPWARYSLKAQQELERTGAVPHPYLARLVPLQGTQEAPDGEDQGALPEAEEEASG